MNEANFSTDCSYLTFDFIAKLKGILFPAPAFLALFLNCFFTVFIWKQTSSHPNTRLLLLNVSFCANMLCISHIIISLYFAAIAAHGAYFTVPLVHCLTFHMFFFYFSVVFIMAMAVLGVERMVFCFSKSLQQQNLTKPTKLAKILLICPFLLSIGPTLGVLKSMKRQSRVCYCPEELFLPNQRLTGMIFALVTECLTIGTHLVVYLRSRYAMINFGLNQATSTLAERFAFWENVQIVKSLLPTALGMTIAFSISATLKLILSNHHHDSVYINYFSISRAVVLLYLVIHPILCMMGHKNWREKVLKFKCWPKNSVGPPTQRKSAVVKNHKLGNPEQSQAIIDKFWEDRRISKATTFSAYEEMTSLGKMISIGLGQVSQHSRQNQKDTSSKSKRQALYMIDSSLPQIDG